MTKADYNGLPIRSVISSSSLDPNNPNVRWFNSGANIPFAQAPVGTLGDASIFNTHLRNPWYRYEAISVNKEIRVQERVQFKYNVNVFNPFNRTDFGNITSTINSANFGRPTGAMVAARTITMGLRLTVLAMVATKTVPRGAPDWCIIVGFEDPPRLSRPQLWAALRRP